MAKPPVAFLVFNRPDYTRRVFEEIRRFQPDRLLLVADGPRPSVSTDQSRCAAVREIIRNVDWPCDVRENLSDKNLGCKARIASGLDWIFSEVEEAIILEDDCVPCPDFFRFCSEMLERYRNESKIMHISGCNLQDGTRRGKESYYFSRFPVAWGWASWRRAWKHYDADLNTWPAAKKSGLLRSLGFGRLECEYWTNLFDLTLSGEIDTWDYQWGYTCWRMGGLGITPNVNLISNIGAGPDATHTKGPEGSLAIPTGTLGEMTHPKRIIRNLEADRYTADETFGAKKMREDRLILPRVLRKLGRIKRRLLQAASPG